MQAKINIAFKQFYELSKNLIKNEKTYFYSPVQRRTSKCVIIFGVHHYLHYIVSMTFKYLGTGPLFFPIPQLN